MKASLRRRLLSTHRWIGGGCAVFLVLLSLTGLALNHSERLGLHRRMVTADWVLERYGMALALPRSAVAVGGAHAAVIEGELWFDGTPKTKMDALRGVLAGPEVLFFADDAQLVLLTRDGELIDVVPLPAVTADAAWGEAAGRPALRENGKTWSLDPAFARWEATEADWTPRPLDAAPLPRESHRQWKAAYSGGGLSLYRVLLDVHAGRFFGLPGTLVMDLTALAILYLAGSGVWVWRARRGREPTREASADAPRH